MLCRKTKWTTVETESNNGVLFQIGKAFLFNKAVSNWRPERGVHVLRKNSPVNRNSKCKGLEMKMCL